MGRSVLLGGGTYEEMDDLCRIMAELSGKALPNALFIGTALKDSTNPLTSFKKSFKRACPGAQVKKLSIIRTSYTEEEVDALLSWADVIFVGGGDTSYLIAEWRKIGLDQKLATIYHKDEAVLAGVSAGAICWFQKGYTDSASFRGEEDWEYELIEPGISLYPEFFCPHYNDRRRDGFDELACSLRTPAIALEDCTAMIDRGGEISFHSVNPAHHAYRFLMKDGIYQKIQVV